MAPFSVPAPRVRPLRPDLFGGPKAIDTNTKIEMSCDTYLKYEIFYTLDGTRPQPFLGIVQGSKTYKYKSPFHLPVGKFTVKAIAISSKIHSMRSSVVTKCFEVMKAVDPPQAKIVLNGKNINVRNAVVHHGRAVLDVIKGLADSPSDCASSDTHPIPRDDKHFDDCSKVTFRAHPQNGHNQGLSKEPDSTDRLAQMLQYPDSDKETESDAIGSISQAGSIDGIEEIVETEELPSIQEPHSSSSESQPENKKKHLANNLPNVAENTAQWAMDQWKRVTKKVPPPTNQHPRCVRCLATVQHCLMCHKQNFITSKYCIECGAKLVRKCQHCKHTNYIVATYCQFCGKKLVDSGGNDKSESSLSADFSHKPEVIKIHASTQISTTTVDKIAQTFPVHTAKKGATISHSPVKKNLPPHSPGRGYWHQQLDYICNHLKSFAYNNKEFRESIQEPALSDFKSANVTKSEDCVTVTMQFSPYIIGEKL